MRWNAAVMVSSANRKGLEVAGGHIATFQSAASLFEVGYNHFFQRQAAPQQHGDHLYIQGHAAPGHLRRRLSSCSG